MAKKKQVDEVVETPVEAVKKRTKFVRTFVHPCDDFTITDDEGNVYYPHLGETVTFRCDLPWEMINADEGQNGIESFMLLLNVLLRQIRDWTWTDDDNVLRVTPTGDPNAPDSTQSTMELAKAFTSELIDLSPEERGYLYSNCWKKANLGEVSGSAS